MPTGGVQYSYAQLEYIWEQAGGNAQMAPTMAAIAMAESGGWSGAYNNDTNGTQDRGLWQINTVNGSLSTFDVMGNARAAVSILGSQGLTAWTTYQTGAYLQYLQSGTAPDPSAPINATTAASNNAGGQPGTGGSNQLLSSSCSGWSFFDPACWIRKIEGTASETVLRFILSAVLNPLIQIISGTFGMAIGMALMIFALWHLARQSATVRSATDAVAGAAVGAALSPEGFEGLGALLGGQMGAQQGQQSAQTSQARRRASDARESYVRRYARPQQTELAANDVIAGEARTFGPPVIDV